MAKSNVSNLNLGHNNPNVVKVALEKVLPKKFKETSKGIADNQHGTFDIHVHMKGKLNKGADYERAPTITIGPKALIRYMLKEMGLRDGKKALKVLQDIYQVSLASTGTGQEADAVMEEETSQRVDEILKEFTNSLPKSKVSGQITFNDLQVMISTSGKGE